MTHPQGFADQPTTFDQLLQPIQAPLCHIENTRKVHARESLSLRAFTRLLVYYFTASVESGRQLLSATLSAAAELGLEQVKRSTFFDGFNRFPVHHFQVLFGLLVSTLPLQVIPELAPLGRLLCVDGSLFPALANMYWATYQSGCNALKLHLAFELNRMIVVEILVSSGNSSERTALRQMLETGVTYLLNRGYVSFQLLDQIASVSAYFVMRMKSNLNYDVLETRTVHLPEAVEGLYKHVGDLRVCLPGAAGKPVYRLVFFCFEGTTYRLLTNRWDLTTFEVMLLYSYRWQVELIFRHFKHTLSGLHLLSTTQQGVTIQFYGLLITALLQLHLKQACVAALEGESSSLLWPGPGFDGKVLGEGRYSTLLVTVGDKLHQLWRISVHWLVHLRNLLARPCGRAAVDLLGRS